MRVLDTLEGILPTHVRFHLFRIKSAAVSKLKDRPRVASVDSMAWNNGADSDEGRPPVMAHAFNIGCIAEEAVLHLGHAVPIVGWPEALNDWHRRRCFPSRQFSIPDSNRSNCFRQRVDSLFHALRDLFLVPRYFGFTAIHS